MISALIQVISYKLEGEALIICAYSWKFNSPNKHFLHQRLIEIIPLGATELEEHEQLANLVYQMRRLNIAYDAHTIFPYPLHIVNSLKKYMTFLNSEFESTKFDETVILGDSEKIELALH